MAKEVSVTLKSELQNHEPEVVEKIRKKIIGVQMLACVQNNLMDDIRRLLEEKGRWKYEIKHNMKQIQELCARNIKNDSFFGRMSQDAIDVYFDGYERLEKMIYDFVDSNG